jgi:hypothetical protein
MSDAAQSFFCFEDVSKGNHIGNGNDELTVVVPQEQ